MQLSRIGIGSAAKLSGAMYAAFGLIAGVIVGILSAFGAGLASMAGDADAPPAFLAPLLGVGAIIFLPLLYGLFGLCIGAVSAALYNLLARMVGGLEVELH